jgi:hypothetical protein
LGLSVAAEVSQTLGPEKLETSRSGRNFQSAIEEVESLSIVSYAEGSLRVRLVFLQNP